MSSVINTLCKWLFAFGLTYVAFVLAKANNPACMYVGMAGFIAYLVAIND